ncbi:MAG TPA: hypothetical protein VGA67_00050 [Candidatus Dojkabacteria bacterium]|jgi:hypothetical protein
MNYIITHAEELTYNNLGEMSDRLKAFWMDFVSKLPKELQKEALDKGFKLTRYSFIEESVNFSHNVKFDIPKASKELVSIMNDPGNILICMRDPV